VRVGHRRPRASPPERCRPGLGACAARADAQRAAVVHPEQASPAGAHRLDEHPRERDRHAGHAPTRLDERLAVEHESHVGARPTDVDGQRPVEPRRARDERCADDPAGGAGEGEGGGGAGGLCRAAQATAGGHHGRRRIAGSLHPAGQAVQVAGDDRSRIGLGRDRRRALVLADLGQHVGRQHHVEPGRLVGDRCGEETLVPGVGIRVQQRDGDDVRSPPDHRAGDPARRGRGQRPLDAVGGDALGNGHQIVGGDERRRVLGGEIVEPGALLAAQGQQVGRARRGAEDDAGPRALEEQVRHDGRAVHDALDLLRGGAERGQRPLDALALVAGRAEHFPGVKRAAGIDGSEIGERPTDVDADGPPGSATASPALVRRSRPSRHYCPGGRESGFFLRRPSGQLHPSPRARTRVSMLENTDVPEIRTTGAPGPGGTCPPAA
jgi:hypothetical protein